MLSDYLNEFRKGKDRDFNIQCFGYAPACGLSLDLANRYKVFLGSIVKKGGILLTYRGYRTELHLLCLQMILLAN